MPARGPFQLPKMSTKLGKLDKALKEKPNKRRRLSLGGVYTSNSGAVRAATNGLAPQQKSKL